MNELEVLYSLWDKPCGLCGGDSFDGHLLRLNLLATEPNRRWLFVCPKKTRSKKTKP